MGTAVRTKAMASVATVHSLKVLRMTVEGLVEIQAGTG
jgi:hypothetical protein